MNTTGPAASPITKEVLKALSLRMGFQCCIPASHLPLAGSPERSRERMAIQTEQGFWVLEAFSPDQILRKQEIITFLFQLERLGLRSLLLPLKDEEGRVFFKHQKTFFQITPHITCEDLPRPAYLLDAWRGWELAGFVMDLLSKKTDMETFVRKEGKTSFARKAFDIRSYIVTLMQGIRIRRRDLYERLFSIQIWTEEALSPYMEKVPKTFCHGDLHPINVLWGKKHLLHLIDWEFCGIKPEIHDMANLLGCLGSEDPKALEGPFAEAFLTRIAESGHISQAGWQALVPMVVAIRFCWLSEWLRKEDTAMITLECHYLELLVHHAGDIQQLWHSLVT